MALKRERWFGLKLGFKPQLRVVSGGTPDTAGRRPAPPDGPFYITMPPSTVRTWPVT